MNDHVKKLIFNSKHFILGAADVSQGFPHPRCYLNPKVRRAPGYGTCMLSELAGKLDDSFFMTSLLY